MHGILLAQSTKVRGSNKRPVISISQASKVCATSYQSAKKNVDQLVRLGILQQVKGFENPKLYWAKEIIDISDGW